MSKGKLTAEQRLIYVVRQGSHCPYCGSESLDHDPPRFEGPKVVSIGWCWSCDRTWKSVFSLLNVKEVNL